MPFSFAGPHSQNPAFVTHPALHIRDAHDAQVVLEAVRQNILPLIKRRLLASEREQLRSGHVYVWEEAQDDGGLLRWTDGRRWSQSRMRGDYLFYEEKIETTQEERDAKAARRAYRASDPKANIPPPIRRKDRPSKPNGLTKQTYSVTVQLSETGDVRKWHVVAYFSSRDYARLPVIEYYDYLRNIRPPSGVFISNKNLCGKPDRMYASDDSEANDDGPPSAYGDGYSLHQSPSPLLLPSPTVQRPVLSPSTSTGGSLSPNSSLGPAAQERRLTLPDPRRKATHDSLSTPAYAPLSSEDRKALNRFKVIL